MKITYTVEGDHIEDREDLDIFFNANRLYCTVWEAREAIRQRLKWRDEKISDVEFLEQIYQMLHVPGFE